jgi:cell shape-determining protein MreC
MLKAVNELQASLKALRNENEHLKNLLWAIRQSDVSTSDGRDYFYTMITFINEVLDDDTDGA